MQSKTWQSLAKRRHIRRRYWKRYAMKHCISTLVKLTVVCPMWQVVAEMVEKRSLSTRADVPSKLPELAKKWSKDNAASTRTKTLAAKFQPCEDRSPPVGKVADNFVKLRSKDEQQPIEGVVAFQELPVKIYTTSKKEDDLERAEDSKPLEKTTSREFSAQISMPSRGNVERKGCDEAMYLRK